MRHPRSGARALGRVSASFRVTLVGCVAVNEHTRSFLPEVLGGTADRIDASDATLNLSEASFASSPSGRLRPSTPGSLLPGTLGRPHARRPTPSQSALARAAHEAIGAAEAAEGDAAGATAASEAALVRRNEAAVELRVAEHQHTSAWGTYEALAHAMEPFELRDAEAAPARQRVSAALARARDARAEADASCSALSAA